MAIEYKAKLAYNIPGGPFTLCHCRYCETELINTLGTLDRLTSHRGMPFTVCSTCGNKRCPKATYHGHDCTDSNEPGQPLSVYGGFQLPEIREDEDDD